MTLKGLLQLSLHNSITFFFYYKQKEQDRNIRLRKRMISLRQFTFDTSERTPINEITTLKLEETRIERALWLKWAPFQDPIESLLVGQ